ncbi:MAG TPA: sensor histidine kinase [Bacteroidetes bacterium]|nr:sensor histidine kinase [Bacteroidota bacterium]
MFSHPLIDKYNWIYFLSACFMLSGLLFMVFNNAGLSFEGALYDAISSTLLFGIVMLYLVSTLRFYHPKKHVLLYIGGGSLLLSILYTVILEMLYPLIYAEWELVLLRNPYFWPRYLFTLLLFASAMAITWFYYQMHDLQNSLARQEESDKVAREAELYKLRQQLQPHFLFNSLNSINALIGSQPDLARKMVLQLSDFFRGTLRREESKFIPLSEELDYIQLYLEIEQVRFGHRLQATVDVDESLLKLPIPPLVLQPIMENAIKFGLYGTIGDVCIRVKAFREDPFLVLEISNPFEDGSGQAKGTGFGLAAIQRRLYLLFARNDLFTTRSNEGLFTAQIKIPIPHD